MIDKLAEARQKLCKNCVDNKVNHYKTKGRSDLECWRELEPLDSEGRDCPYFRQKEWYQ